MCHYATQHEDAENWTNYETYIAQIHAVQSPAFHTIKADPEELASDLETHYRKQIPQGIQGVILDLIINAIHSVNWREIANSLLEDL